jgi:hypothetical protein
MLRPVTARIGNESIALGPAKIATVAR